jgi:hypothetical protein
METVFFTAENVRKSMIRKRKQINYTITHHDTTQLMFSSLLSDNYLCKESKCKAVLLGVLYQSSSTCSWYRRHSPYLKRVNTFVHFYNSVFTSLLGQTWLTNMHTNLRHKRIPHARSTCHCLKCWTRMNQLRLRFRLLVHGLQETLCGHSWATKEPMHIIHGCLWDR